jgi:hypothetical protein
MSRTKSLILSGCFLAVSMVFVWRSFYAMRITTAKGDTAPRRGQARKRVAPSSDPLAARSGERVRERGRR